MERISRRKTLQRDALSRSDAPGERRKLSLSKMAALCRGAATPRFMRHGASATMRDVFGFLMKLLTERGGVVFEICRQSWALKATGGSRSPSTARLEVPAPSLQPICVREWLRLVALEATSSTVVCR
jgi:hypothetical protein